MPQTASIDTSTASRSPATPSATKSRKKLPQELQLIDYLIERWARWASDQLRQIGWPASSISQKLIEWHELGLQPEHLNPKGKSVQEPDGVMAMDNIIAKLPRLQRRCIFTEYFSHQSLEIKAKRMKINVHHYRQTLRAAQWVIYGSINAD